MLFNQPNTVNQPFAPLNVHPALVRWMEHLGFNHADIEELKLWDLKKLPSFWELKDMAKVVDRIIQAVELNQPVAIFGDYDVDGTTSCALFYRFFQKINYPVKLYQPSRFVDGYGLHKTSITKANEDGIKLLITVDCGTSSHEAADEALKVGIDLIITDHHKDAAPTMPNALAIINPNRRDETTSALQALAGVGVAFAVCVCVREKLLQKGISVSSLYDLLPYVAVGTISDLAPLNSMNLILCRHGMKQLMTMPHPAWKVFLAEKEYSPKYFESDLISFYIGPMINSKGRLEHPESALNLLTTDNFEHAAHYYQNLIFSNAERRKIQLEIFEQAKSLVEREILQQDTPIIVVYQPGWHEGVIGIVAAKLVEHFKRPAMVFTNSADKEFIKASARTYRNIDLFSLLKSQEKFYEKFGGHKAAAGLTIHVKDFLDFKESITHYFNLLPLSDLAHTNEDPIIEIEFENIDDQLLDAIYQFAPFGQGNPMPKWRIKGAKLVSYNILKNLHVKWNWTSTKPNDFFRRQYQGISFNYFSGQDILQPQQLMLHSNPVTIDAWIKVNTFRNNNFLQLIVDRVHL